MWIQEVPLSPNNFKHKNKEISSDYQIQRSVAYSHADNGADWKEGNSQNVDELPGMSAD